MPDVPFQLNRLTRAICVSALLCVLAFQLMHVARATSATWDEAHHLFDGYTIWKFHDYSLNPEVPPLVKLTAASPLLPMHLDVPANQGRSVPMEAFLDGRAFVFGNGGDRVLFPARMACVVFMLGLALLVYAAGAEMFSPVAGLFALALIVFDPNFLAHSALVTTDVGSSFFFLAAVYAFYRYCKKPGWPRLLLTGVIAGLLLAAKFTGIFLLPMLLLCVLLEWALTRRTQILWQRLAAVLAIGLIAWIVLWSFYGFRYKAAPEGRDLNPTLTAYLATMYDQRAAQSLEIVARYRILPEAYIWGLENTKNTEFEDNSYFWGRVYRHGNRAYFPVAFLIKSTLPFLILLCLSPLAWKWGLRKKLRELSFLLIPVAVYLAISINSDMDIGLRHLLPVYAFLYVLIAGTALTLTDRNPRWRIAFAVLLCWQVVTSYRVAPAYMAYGNEAWGGPSQVHRYLSDANTDWAQQLKAIKTYLDERHISNCWFVYFADGAVQPSDYGIPCKRLPTTVTLWWLDLPMQVPPVIDGTVLISDSDRTGIEFGDGALNPYDSFLRIKPNATIQHGVYVYTGQFPVPLAAALVEAHEAQKLISAGSMSAALQKANDAAKLAPESAHVQSILGDALVASSNPIDGLEHYRLALHAAQTIRPDLQAGIAADLNQKIDKLKAIQPGP
jgi:4-amino-4-deoxy-L-arabinose transferase-like glycosyltransferase